MSGFFFFQAEDGIRDLVRSRGLGDVYKRQEQIAPELVADGGVVLQLRDQIEAEGALEQVARLALSLIHI